MDRRLREEKYWLKEQFGERAGFTGPDGWMRKVLEPSNTEASRMFSVGCLGVDLLVEAGLPEHFPATKRRVRKRGARFIADELSAERGLRAAVLLTHAIPTYQAGWWRGLHYASMGGPQAYFQDPAWHEEVRTRLAAYYPLDAEGEERLRRCALRHRAWQGEVATDLLEDTGFTMALKRGADATEPLGLADGHRLGADQWFEVEALHQALRTCAGDEDYERLEPDLVHAYGPYPDLPYLAGLSAFWADIVMEYLDVLVPRRRTDSRASPPSRSPPAADRSAGA